MVPIDELCRGTYSDVRSRRSMAVSLKELKPRDERLFIRNRTEGKEKFNQGTRLLARFPVDLFHDFDGVVPLPVAEHKTAFYRGRDVACFGVRVEALDAIPSR